jgi:murein tripeptide amidase MpaA
MSSTSAGSPGSSAVASLPAAGVQITSQFDAGAIEVLSCERADAIRLRFRPDSHAEFAQWFYFRLSGAQGTACTITLENAAQCAFPGGWPDYQALASYDNQNWFRVPTRYDGQALIIEHSPEFEHVYYAYFEPYGEARHAALMGRLQQHPAVRLRTLGTSVQGRALTLLTLGQAEAGRPHIWVIARQHPGETMAQWFSEGLLARLTGQGAWAGDPVARLLLERAVFHVVPNMNPDGAALGNLRTNARGANLNREWREPDLERSPEVWHVREAIHALGCDMFFDIHGDETLPYVFVAGCEMLPEFGERQQREQSAFIESFKAVSPDFQSRHGYSSDKYREDALKLASKYVGHAFGCLSLTLEMPFKDNANLPEPTYGWSGARSAALGAAMLAAVLRQLEQFGPGAVN